MEPRPAAHELSLRDVLRMLRRRRGLTLAVLVLVLSGFAAYYALVTPLYRASVRLLIDPDTPNVVSFDEVVKPATTQLDYYQTQRGILESRMLARRTLDTLKLWTHPEFTRVGRLSRALAWIDHAIPRQRPAAGAPPETAAQSRAIDAFLEGLELSARADTRLMEVSFAATDATLATAIANTLAHEYIDQSLEYRFRATRDASDWLADQLAEQRRRVEASELQLQKYLEQNAGISLPEQQKIIVDNIGDISAAVTRAQTERMEAQSLYEQLRSITATSSALDSFPIVLDNPFIRELKTSLADLRGQEAKLAERFGDRHPELVKLRSNLRKVESDLQLEIAKVVESVRQQALAARAREQSLAVGLAAQKSNALAGSRKTLEYQVLQREVASSRAMFESLLQRTREAGISSELRTSNVRVVDPAEVPIRPSWPRTLPLAALALLVALPLAFGLPLVLAYFDDTIRTLDDVRTALGLPLLGLLPVVHRRRVLPALHGSGDAREFDEAIRTIRSAVIKACGDNDSRTLLVTSSRPGEGKTIVAANLAAAFAQIGHRVLLIDGDLRAPRVHELFALPRAPGFVEVLQNGAAVRHAIHSTSVKGLDVLTAGAPPANPLDLLQSKLAQVLPAPRAHFDWIVIDSPPVLAVSDATVLAQPGTNVLFVIEADATTRRDAVEAMAQLRAAGAGLLGAVLNRVDLKRHRYEYAPYGRPEFQRYRRDHAA
jgi:capsular exopolysaccharide synthesis family protein